MIFTVVWIPSCEDRLATVWLKSTNRNAVTRSAKRIDDLLRVDPEQRGDFWYDTVRSVVIGVLRIAFEIIEEDRLVRILYVWDSSEGLPKPPMNGQLNR